MLDLSVLAIPLLGHLTLRLGLLIHDFAQDNISDKASKVDSSCESAK